MALQWRQKSRTMGGISGLEASNTQDAIDELATRASGVDIDTLKDIYYGSIEEREALAYAITDQGVPTETSDSLTTMSNNIRQLYSGGNAAAENITEGYSAWVNGVLIHGTRPTPVFTQSGTIQVSCYLNESKTAVITFEKEFDTVPSIAVVKGSEWGASSGGSSSNIKYSGAASVTTKGFVLQYYSSGNSGGNGAYRYCNFTWTATAK